MSDWLKQLKNPPAAFRPMPFWAWNSRLDKAELVRQVGELARAGMGGFFMHVRYGLETEYLSTEFLDCVKTVVAAAKKRNMQAWLYDEDRWPSGFAGGAATADPKNRIKFLMLEKVAADTFTGPPDDAIRCFTALVDGSTANDVRPLPLGQRPPTGGCPARTVLVCRAGVSGEVGWFNNTGYLDAMSPEAVRAFIDATHEVYKKAVGDEFGKTIPGIFTDEPNIGHFRTWGKETDATVAIPWTTGLAAEFRRRFDYDLLDHLVELFYDVDAAQPAAAAPSAVGPGPGTARLAGVAKPPSAVSQARHDYRRLTAELYTEAFSRQIGQWCGQNNLELTGHELQEHALPVQIDQVGSCMPHYEHFQRPGIDLLMDRQPEVLTAKQCVSVASQLGRPRVLSELYGCTGWDATFEMYKHIGDWHQALGLNHFCPHLSWYSMAGGAKRDYPAGIFYQSPWWPNHKLLADYFARLSLALSQGQAVREVAVIHPIESAWLVHKKQDPQASTALDESLKHLCGLLLDNQFDFDFADESMLPRYASIEAGVDKTRAEDGPARRTVRFRIGQASYRAVLVPESVTLRGTTVELLEKFLDAGGQVLFAGQLPTLVDCRASERLAALAARSTRVPLSLAGLTMALGEVCRPVRISPARWNDKGEPVAWIHLRNIDGGQPGQPGQLLFVHHRDRTREFDVIVRWAEDDRADGGRELNEARSPDDRARGRAGSHVRIRQIDPLSGRITDVPGVETKDGAQTFMVALEPTGSRLFLRTTEPGPSEPGRPRPRFSPAPVEQLRIPLSPVWDYALDEPNAMNLDYCRVRVLDVADGTGGQAGCPSGTPLSPALGSPPRGGSQDWRPRKLIWQHEADIRREFGFRDNSRPAEQPYIWLKNLSARVAKVEVEFEVPAEAAPTGPVSLVIEHPERFEISVNGKLVQVAAGLPSNKEAPLTQGKQNVDWFIDRSFRIVPLTPSPAGGGSGRGGIRLTKGVNRIVLRTDYREHHWLEEVYLIGRFGVRTAGDRAVVTALPKKLAVGDWCGQGLAMYSGGVSYRQTVRVPKLAKGKRVVLKMDRPKATVIRVAVNGRSVGAIGWQPWQVDITDAVKFGSANKVEISLVSSRRNLLGPLHYLPSNPLWTGPAEFRSEDPLRFTPGYNLVRYGLLGEAYLAVEA